jgi:hypothetical protein
VTQWRHHIASSGPIVSTIILFEAAKSIICIGGRYLWTEMSTCGQLLVTERVVGMQMAVLLRGMDDYYYKD